MIKVTERRRRTGVHKQKFALCHLLSSKCIVSPDRLRWETARRLCPIFCGIAPHSIRHLPPTEHAWAVNKEDGMADEIDEKIIQDFAQE
ncbi:MAG: hypothetical protein ABSA13_19380, partial [Beijerinckiaceae bacterium]